MPTETNDRTGQEQKPPDVLTVLTLVMKNGDTHAIPLGENWSVAKIQDCAKAIRTCVFPRWRLFKRIRELVIGPTFLKLEVFAGDMNRISAHCAYFNRWRIAGFRIDTLVQHKQLAMLTGLMRTQGGNPSADQSLEQYNKTQQDLIAEIKRANDLRDKELRHGEEWRDDDDEDELDKGDEDE